MIITRAPLRISFVGGGTDLADFYRQYPGRVISATIDKFTYVTINHIPHTKKIIVKYRDMETVDHPSELKHTRVKHALTDLGIDKDIEIGSFADISSNAGLGSSSAFSTALVKGLHSFKGKNLTREEAAKEACRLEIDLLKEPIGKQDQYAAAYGGFNIFQFNPNDTVDVKPVYISHDNKINWQNHLMLFFTGVTRAAGDILSQQKSNISNKMDTLKEMSDSVFEFENKLLAGDYKGLGDILDQAWRKKRSLASNISNSIFDQLYETGIKAGAWGGKILGAGGGGCMLFVASPEKQNEIRKAVLDFANQNKMIGFEEIAVKFTECGTDIVYRANR